jgi:hypothetical protein
MVNFIEIIDIYINEKKRCFINGMPDSNIKGTITARGDDYIEFETLKVEVEKKSQKEKTTREVVIIPIDKIKTLSSGAVTTEVNMLDKAMKALEE